MDSRMKENNLIDRRLKEVFGSKSPKDYSDRSQKKTRKYKNQKQA